MFESLQIVSNPVVVIAVFLVLPAVCWWVFQTAYQNRWLADSENFRWSRVFRSLRITSAVLFAIGSLIVSIIGALLIADFVEAKSETALPLLMLVVLLLAGFFAGGWALELSFNSVHSRYPEEYDRNSKANGIPSCSRPYNQRKAAIDLAGLVVAIPLALTLVVVIGIGAVTIAGAILAALGIFISLPVYVVLAVLIIGFLLVSMAVFGM